MSWLWCSTQPPFSLSTQYSREFLQRGFSLVKVRVSFAFDTQLVFCFEPVLLLTALAGQECARETYTDQTGLECMEMFLLCLCSADTYLVHVL